VLTVRPNLEGIATIATDDEVRLGVSEPSQSDLDLTPTSILIEVEGCRIRTDTLHKGGIGLAVALDLDAVLIRVPVAIGGGDIALQGDRERPAGLNNVQGDLAPTQ